jgi:large subunit ribosomal protein L15
MTTELGTNEMRLNEIRDRDGATKARKRLGRGIGSGLGKTSGRGVKGQKARTGVAIKGFEGGQMPLHRRLPKRGFNNVFANDYNELNLGRVQAAVDAGRLDGKKPITVEALKEAGLIRRAKDGVRILGHGELKSKLAFEVTGASQSAIKAIEAAGGSVTLKPLNGRERPEADRIKAERRAAKRDAGKPAAKSAKADGEQADDKKEAKAAKKPKAGDAEGGKTPKAKPASAKKDES